MAFFNATTEKGKAKVSAMQDFVDGLEANGIPVPEHVRSELDYYNNILVRHVADQYLSDSGEKLENYDVPDAYAEETKRRKNQEDRDAVGQAYDVMMGDDVPDVDAGLDRRLFGFMHDKPLLDLEHNKLTMKGRSTRKPPKRTSDK